VESGELSASLPSKTYLTRAELASQVGSWTPKTISRLIEKRVLREGEHYFIDPRGRGYLFRWDRVVDVIESNGACSHPTPADAVPMLAGGSLGNGAAKGTARGL
jgi:hypothetical protein